MFDANESKIRFGENFSGKLQVHTTSVEADHI